MYGFIPIYTAMRVIANYIAASCHIIAPFVSVFCSRLLIKYLKSKSLGMQTLLDKFMIELQYAYIFMSLAANYSMATGNLFSNNLNEYVQFVLVGFVMLAIHLLFLHLAVYLVIKYMSIYHSTILQYEIDESLLIVRVRIGLYVFASLLVGFDFITNGVHQLIPYQVLVYGIAQTDGHWGTTFEGLAFLSLLLLILLQFRIEYDNFVFNEAINSYQRGLHINQSPTNPNSNNLPESPELDEQKVKLNCVRFSVLVGAICFLVIFVLIPETTSEKNLQLIAVLAYILIFHCIMPTMYILSYPNLKSFTIIKVKSYFC
jgi:hypothetical protein